ncbi:phage tail tape measure protein [Pseudomonas putida]|uniref:phage tail tape measure protein n=1 Tax=Pseudomonas putida TaxID=303 RepID=UPI001C24D4F4|nr:phage tail tape measure protein [Pseudomonas putida]
MSSDLRVALHINAHAGQSRREVQALERDLRQAGKNGAKALADESWKAGAAINRVGQQGATSYRIVRQAMRDAATQGADVLKQKVSAAGNELKQLGADGRKAAQETKTEMTRAAREGVTPLARSADQAESSMRRLAQNGGRHLRALKAVALGVRAEVERLRNFGSSTMGQLAGFGVGVGAAASLKGSAVLERQMIRTQQTAGMTYAQRDEWKNEGRRIGIAYGVDPAAIYAGGDTLLAGGMSYGTVKASADAIGQATAVTGADSGVLAKALMTGSSAFNIDLEKTGAALDMLQKMTVAGRLGNAELENLSDIFPKIGSGAKAAGMSIEQALAYVETLSAMEANPDRLGTLAESTLRVFTNGQYRKQVSKATGISYFNKDGSQRNPQDVLSDLSTQYGRLTTDKERSTYMDKVFKGMDQDTLRGIRYLLSGNVLSDFSKNTGEIKRAKPVFESDLADNVKSSTGAAGRLRATLGGAIDRMAQPINAAFADMSGYLLDDLNLSGDQMLAGGLATAVGGYYAGRGAKKGAGMLFNKLLGGQDTLKNIAVGRVLEEATGVQSVFVTNWPVSGVAGLPDVASPGKGGKGGNGGSGVAVPGVGLTALGIMATQIGGASAQGDEARLDLAGRNKLLNEGQRTYQQAFYRQRLSLAGQVPEGLGYAEREGWLSSNAQRLAQQETGLTATGSTVVSGNAWAAEMTSRLMQVALSPPGADKSDVAEKRLAQLLSEPLVISLHLNNDMLLAEVERRAGIQVRRGQ